MKEAVEEAFAAGPGEGRVRHRDAVARHQHAGALGRASRSSRSSPASATSSSRRGSTPSSPAGPGGAGSTTVGYADRAAGARSCRSTRWPGSRRGGRTRSTSSFRPTYNMAANLVRRYPSRGRPPPAEPVVRAVPGRPRRRRARAPARTEPGAARAPPPDGDAAGRATSTSTGRLVADRDADRTGPQRGRRSTTRIGPAAPGRRAVRVRRGGGRVGRPEARGAAAAGPGSSRSTEPRASSGSVPPTSTRPPVADRPTSSSPSRTRRAARRSARAAADAVAGRCGPTHPTDDDDGDEREAKLASADRRAPGGAVPAAVERT